MNDRNLVLWTTIGVGGFQYTSDKFMHMYNWMFSGGGSSTRTSGIRFSNYSLKLRIL